MYRIVHIIYNSVVAAFTHYVIHSLRCQTVAFCFIVPLEELELMAIHRLYALLFNQTFFSYDVQKLSLTFS